MTHSITTHALADHHQDMMNALLVLELIGETSDFLTPRIESILALGKAAIGNKIELLEKIMDSQPTARSANHE